MKITLAEMRNRVATALADELGTKTFGTVRGGEATVQALTIDNGSVPVTSGIPWVQKPKRHTGLEVVIEPEINSSIFPLLGGDFYLEHTTRITLKQFDITDTTQTARSLLIKEFGNVIDRIGPRVLRNVALDSVEQQSFDITQNASS